MSAITGLRHELSEGWKSLAEGWSQIRERASSAMTRYRRGSVSNADTALGDAALSSPSWGLLAGEVFEDRDRVVVRLEAPGMDVKDFDLQIVGDLLCVRGEKRSSHESGDGHYRLLECAYGTSSARSGCRRRFAPTRRGRAIAAVFSPSSCQR